MKTCLRSAHSKKIARRMKFQIYKEEGLFYICSENKEAGPLCS